MGQNSVWHSFSPGVRRLALGLMAIQAALIVAHLLAYDAAAGAADPKITRHFLDFNQEGSLPTWWSALVMTGAGLAAITAGARRPGGRAMSFAWFMVGAGFVWLGLEESLLHAHEDAQIASGIDWPVIYLPALGVGAWAVLRVTRDLDPPFGRLMLLALGVLAAAVVAELLSSPSIAINFNLRNLVEENLELAGATLVLIATLAGSRLSGSLALLAPSVGTR
jgi:hypothetical protein